MAPLASRLTLDRVLNALPHVRFAMAYGSGVFPQQQHRSGDDVDGGARPMVDFLLAVDSDQRLKWHTRVVEDYPNHYSMLARAALNCSTWSRRMFEQVHNSGAGLWYNTLIRWDEEFMVKYGVISVENMLEDLHDWSTMYTSGRLHKPVDILRSDPQFDEAMAVNLQHALSTAILLMDGDSSRRKGALVDKRLFKTIAALSYTGDIRMGWGEHPRKVANIVDRNLNRFRNLYRNPLDKLTKQNIVKMERDSPSSDDIELPLEIHISPNQRLELLSSLPSNIRQRVFRYICLRKRLGKVSPSESIELSKQASAWEPIADDKELAALSIRLAIQNVVWSTSLRQSVKGIITAGPIKSFRYTIAKMSKALLG